MEDQMVGLTEDEALRIVEIADSSETRKRLCAVAAMFTKVA